MLSEYLVNVLRGWAGRVCKNIGAVSGLIVLCVGFGMERDAVLNIKREGRREVCVCVGAWVCVVGVGVSYKLW